jgi:hypothetical protein
MLTVVTATAVAVTGCSVSRPNGQHVEQLPPELVCTIVEGEAAGFWSEARDGWWQEGGSMLLVARSDGEPDSARALSAACGEAAESVFELLDQRGIRYGDTRRNEIEDELARSLASGGEATFPRARINRDIIEHCVREPGATEHWRSRVLVEYPIAYLRGDVRNVEWERDKLAREAATLVESAEGFLDDGLWLAGLSELSRAGLAHDGMGLPETDALRGAVMLETLNSAAEGAARSLMVEPDTVTTPLVIRAGETTQIRFRLSFERGGQRMPAVGVPVAFESPEWGVIVRAERVSGVNGSVSVAVRAAENARCGRMRAHIDRTALAATPARRFAGFIADDSSSTAVEIQVISERGVTVCLDLNDGEIAAARRLTDAFGPALARYGCTLEPCGPGTDIIVRGELSPDVVRPSVEGEQILAVLSVEAFDQRSALQIARTIVSVAWPSRDDREEAEALALREVGRLLAVYLESRIVPD